MSRGFVRRGLGIAMMLAFYAGWEVAEKPPTPTLKTVALHPAEPTPHREEAQRDK